MLQRSRPPAESRSRQMMWMTGRLLLLAGLYLLFYAGGLYTLSLYNRLAARGDTVLPVIESSHRPAQPTDFSMPDTSAALRSNRSSTPTVPHHDYSTVSRIVIPSIQVDAKVVAVGWTMDEAGSEGQSVWQVDDYAVGHHQGSANPGEGGNCVLSGHVSGEGRVFRRLYALSPGHQIILYSNGQPYLYVVQERLLVDEEQATPEQRAANLCAIQPTDREMVTLITCWPPDGPERYKQRIIVQAVPAGAPSDRDRQ